MKLIETFESLITNEKYSELNKIIKEKYPKYYSPELMGDLFNWIEGADIKSISFEPLVGAAGIAHYDRLILNKNILNKNILNNNFCYFLYVLLHETSHYYQFKKHGMDIELNAFGSDDVTEVADTILNIEIIADRLAIRKFAMFVKKYDLQCNQPKSYYVGIKNNDYSYNVFLNYIQDVIKMIKEKGIKSNTELVDAIYNMVKS
jgi:hypothetical protein